MAAADRSPARQEGTGGAAWRELVNNVQKFREAQLLGKAELARRAGVSESTIDRIEAGENCRMETKRKILFALGLTLRDVPRVFLKRGNGKAAR
jgi:DNA-binding XRE family transcriptional regulator